MSRPVDSLKVASGRTARRNTVRRRRRRIWSDNSLQARYKVMGQVKAKLGVTEKDILESPQIKIS